MTWTYSGDPSFSGKDAVRFLLGDTDAERPQCTDEELAWLLSQNGSDPARAAAEAARSLAAKYASWATKSVGDLSISYGDLSRQYLTLLATLETQATKKARPRLFAGGISRSDKLGEEQRTDRVLPNATVDQFRNRQN